MYPSSIGRVVESIYHDDPRHGEMRVQRRRRSDVPVHTRLWATVRRMTRVPARDDLVPAKGTTVRPAPALVLGTVALTD